VTVPGLAWLLCALAGLAHPAVGAAKKTEHVPDWVKAAAAVPMPPLRPHDGAVELLAQTNITVDTHGRATVHTREVYKILTVAGRRYADYPVSYDKSAKVNYLHSWTIGADGHEYQEDDKDMADTSVMSDLLYQSGRERVAEALAAEPGAIVAFESDVEQETYTTSWTFDLDQKIPSAGQVLTIALPAGFTETTAWTRIAPVQPTQTASSTWQWVIGPRKSLDDEDSTPALGDVEARMMLAYSGPGVPQVDGNWSTVVSWYEGLMDGREQSSPQIVAEVASLTVGKTGFVDKLLAISGFMQDQVRYVAVEMGIGGWQPHTASDIFRNRYGDCKDKATLLITMLADAGIKAYPLVVDFNHEVDPSLPTHYADHMITAVELPAGVDDPRLQALVTHQGKRFLIFDPTNPVSPAGSLEPELQGSWGILMDGAQTTTLRLPVLDAQDNVLVRTGNFTLAPDGSLTGSVSEVRQGNGADPWRYLFLNGDQRRLEQAENNTLHTALPDFTMTDLNARHTKDRSMPFDVEYKLAVDHYVQHAGTMLLVRPSVVGIYRAENLENGRPRLYPITLGPEEDLREDDTITLPAGYKADDLPEPVHLDSPFATFESTVTMTGNTLHYTRELAIHTMVLPATDLSAYQDFFGKVSNAEREEALLKPGA
jgi:hypothetical protein